MLRLFALLGVFMLACIFAAFNAAFASDAVQTTVVDLGPLLNQVVVPTVIGILGVLGSWVLVKLRTRLGLEASSTAAIMLDKAMQNGLAYAQAEVSKAGPVTVDLHSAIAAKAAAYVTAQAPELLKQLGDTPQSLAAKLQARIALNTTPPEQSVAVPTPPARVAAVADAVAAAVRIGR